MAIPDDNSKTRKTVLETDGVIAAPPPRSARIAMARDTAIIPSEGGEADDSRIILHDVQNSYPWILAHHPEGWAPEVVDDKAVWLPDLRPMMIRPGAGIPTISRTSTIGNEVRKWVRGIEDQGNIVLMPDQHLVPASCLPSGVPAGRFLRALPALNPRYGKRFDFWIEAWKTPIETPPSMSQCFDYDAVGFNRWRLSLVLDGSIRPPMESVLRKYRKAAEKRLDTVLRRSHHDPVFKESRDRDAKQRAAHWRDAALPAAS